MQLVIWHPDQQRVLPPDGGHVRSASHDRTVRIWDIASGRCLDVLEGHTSVVSAAWSDGDREAMSCDKQGELIRRTMGPRSAHP